MVVGADLVTRDELNVEMNPMKVTLTGLLGAQGNTIPATSGVTDGAVLAKNSTQEGFAWSTAIADNVVTLQTSTNARFNLTAASQVKTEIEALSNKEDTLTFQAPLVRTSDTITLDSSVPTLQSGNGDKYLKVSSNGLNWVYGDAGLSKVYGSFSIGANNTVGLYNNQNTILTGFNLTPSSSSNVSALSNGHFQVSRAGTYSVSWNVVLICGPQFIKEARCLLVKYNSSGNQSAIVGETSSVDGGINNDKEIVVLLGANTLVDLAANERVALVAKTDVTAYAMGYHNNTGYGNPPGAHRTWLCVHNVD